MDQKALNGNNKLQKRQVCVDKVGTKIRYGLSVIDNAYFSSSTFTHYYFYDKQAIQNKKDGTGGIGAKIIPAGLCATNNIAKKAWQELSEENK